MPIKIAPGKRREQSDYTRRFDWLNPIRRSPTKMTHSPTRSPEKIETSLFPPQSSHTTSQNTSQFPSNSSGPYAPSSGKIIDRRSTSEIEIQVSPVTTMAAQYDPWAIQTFDLSRQYILSNPTPPIRIANVVTNSTTRSTYRLHWNWLALWDDFEALVYQYWNNVVPQADEQRKVYSRGSYSNASAGCCYRFESFQRGAVRPTDQHSKLQRWEQGVEANNLAGIPDFVMVTEYGNLPRRITAMLEIKNPWQVTPALIDAVINSIIHSPLWLIT